MKEQDIEHYAKEQFPIIPCNLCCSQKNMQRSQIKQLLRSWEQEYPGRIESLFSSLQKIAPPHLANTQLFDFVNLCGNW